MIHYEVQRNGLCIDINGNFVFHSSYTLERHVYGISLGWSDAIMTNIQITRNTFLWKDEIVLFKGDEFIGDSN